MSAISKKTSKLADGRDLFYFDDAGSSLGADRKADLRNLGDRPAVAEMRLDSLTGEWISVAAARHNRAFLPPANQCPLCPTTAGNQSELPDNFDVAVFENKSPSFGPDLLNTDDENFTVVPNLELGSKRPSIGRCEVVVFSPEHLGSLSQMPVSRVRTVIEAWADRTEHLMSLPGVRQVFPFENRGEAIGVTLHHPHGQIYAYSYIPPRVEKMLEAATKYKASTGKVLFDEVVAREIGEEERIMARNDRWIAFVPYAARYPFEIHVAPLNPVADLTGLTDQDRDAFAPIALEVMKRLDGVFGIEMAYIAAWHQAPVRVGRDVLRLHWQITSVRRAPGKLKYLAGSESAMGAFIMDMRPEQSAAQLREVVL